jgi:signal transduction histidine kinase
MPFKLINQKIETEDQKRKVLLGTFLIVFYLLVDVFFFLVNLFNPNGIPILLISGALVSLICFLLLRKGLADWALLLFLARANFIVYYFANQEDLATGTFLHYISYAVIPIAFFGYSDRWKGIAFAIIAFILFLITEFHGYDFSPDKAHFYFIINYGIVLFVTGFIFLFFDRINIQASQEILKRNQELAQANRELDRFVYSASHDLRAPLTSIMGLVNIYQLTNDAEEKQKIIALIANRTEKLDDFIKEILAYSRNARLVITLKKVFLRPLLEECLDSIKFNPGFTSMQIGVEVPSALFVVSDEDRLRMVFLNVLSNAVKYRDPLKTQCILKIIAKKENDSVKIFFEDNGIGIPTEFLTKVFEMFFRAHYHSEGSGLGLYIAKESVEKISGKLEVTSEVTKGTTFIVTLPSRNQASIS